MNPQPLRRPFFPRAHPGTGDSMADQEHSTEMTHYQILKKCIEQGAISEWNTFNASLVSQGQSAHLEAVDLSKMNLRGADLSKAQMSGANLSAADLDRADLSAANLKGAILTAAQLEEADLGGAHFDDAFLIGANMKKANLDFVQFHNTDLSYAVMEGLTFSNAQLKGANFSYAELNGAVFNRAQLEGVSFKGAKLKNSTFSGADLTGANLNSAVLTDSNFRGARLQAADFGSSHLQGAIFSKSNLKSACFNLAICDSSTLFSKCSIDKKSDFRSVGLDNARFSPGLTQLLQYNNRRLNWEEWYRGHRGVGFFVRLFWQFSDYGRSTQRICWWFLGLSFLFAVLYCYIPDVVDGFNGNDGQGAYTGMAKLVRSVYFSFVTMTTLGFGDITAKKVIPGEMNAEYWRVLLGHVLLMLQVIFGYVILGALVTRLSILFSSEDAPLAEFDED